MHNLKKLHLTLLAQLEAAAILRRGSNLEVMLYMKTMTSKLYCDRLERHLYDQLGLFQYKDSFNRTLERGYQHYARLAEHTKTINMQVQSTQFYE